MSVRKCVKCLEFRPVTRFSVNKQWPGGDRTCKACRSEYQRLRRTGQLVFIKTNPAYTAYRAILKQARRTQKSHYQHGLKAGYLGAAAILRDFMGTKPDGGRKPDDR